MHLALKICLVQLGCDLSPSFQFLNQRRPLCFVDHNLIAERVHSASVPRMTFQVPPRYHHHAVRTQISLHWSINWGPNSRQGQGRGRARCVRRTHSYNLTASAGLRDAGPVPIATSSTSIPSPECSSCKPAFEIPATYLRDVRRYEPSSL